MKKNRSRVKYSEGDLLGSCIFISEEETIIDKCGQQRRTGKFLCRCGKNFITRINSVRYGSVKSCGCQREEKIRESLTKHGMTKTPEYNAWLHLRGRCERITDKKYSDYGGRGITVDSSWDKFENFIADMGNRPTEKHSIERVDNNKGYCKENCIWATKKQQLRNKRSTFRIFYNGEVKSLSEWAEIFGIKQTLLRQRIVVRKWTIEEAIKTPVNRTNRYLYGEKKSKING